MLLICGLLFSTACFGTVIRVPEDQQTIALAAVNSSTGDTLRLATQTHLVDETIIIDHDLVILADITDGFGSRALIILSNLNDSVVFRVLGGVKIVLSGFEIRNTQNRAIGAIGNNDFCNTELSDMLISGCDLSLIGETVTLNRVIIEGRWDGIAYFRSDSMIEHAIKVDNSTIKWSRLRFSGSDISVENSVFENNRHIRFGDDGMSSFSNCTFNGLITDGYDMSVIKYDGDITFSNCIFWNRSNLSNFIFENDDYYGRGRLIVNYCCLEGDWARIFYSGNWELTGDNINDNPMFIEQTTELGSNSPCINSGDPNIQLDPDGTIADMGANYYCHGDGVRVPIIMRTSAESGHEVRMSTFMQSTCQTVDIDSVYTNTTAFILSDNHPMKIDSDFSIVNFQIAFVPSENGIFQDTLHIWANTEISNTDNPRHHIIPLVGESGPIPAAVADLSIAILPDKSAHLAWTPVTQTVHGNPVTPHYYLVYFREGDPSMELDWRYLAAVTTPSYDHTAVARFKDRMSYQVIAWHGLDPALLGIRQGDTRNRVELLLGQAASD
jgi:hypothetical protein